MEHAFEYRLVCVEWVDSASSVSGNWIHVEAVPTECVLVRSVGWLVHDSEECKVLLPHLTNDKKQGCGEMIIPASSIRGMVTVCDVLTTQQNQSNPPITKGEPL